MTTNRRIRNEKLHTLLSNINLAEIFGRTDYPELDFPLLTDRSAPFTNNVFGKFADKKGVNDTWGYFLKLDTHNQVMFDAAHTTIEMQDQNLDNQCNQIIREHIVSDQSSTPSTLSALWREEAVAEEKGKPSKPVKVNLPYEMFQKILGLLSKADKDMSIFYESADHLKALFLSAGGGILNRFTDAEKLALKQAGEKDYVVREIDRLIVGLDQYQTIEYHHHLFGMKNALELSVLDAKKMQAALVDLRNRYTKTLSDENQSDQKSMDFKEARAALKKLCDEHIETQRHIITDKHLAHIDADQAKRLKLEILQSLIWFITNKGTEVYQHPEVAIVGLKTIDAQQKQKQHGLLKRPLSLTRRARGDSQASDSASRSSSRSRNDSQTRSAAQDEKSLPQRSRSATHARPSSTSRSGSQAAGIDSDHDQRLTPWSESSLPEGSVSQADTDSDNDENPIFQQRPQSARRARPSTRVSIGDSQDGGDQRQRVSGRSVSARRHRPGEGEPSVFHPISTSHSSINLLIRSGSGASPNASFSASSSGSDDEDESMVVGSVSSASSVSSSASNTSQASQKQGTPPFHPRKPLSASASRKNTHGEFPFFNRGGLMVDITLCQPLSSQTSIKASTPVSVRKNR